MNPSLGFGGITASTVLSRAHLFAQAPDILDHVKQGALRVFSFVNSPAAETFERVEPFLSEDPMMEAVESAIDTEINAEVSKMKLVAQAASAADAESAKEAIVDTPDLTKVNDLLERFEVLPPASADVAVEDQSVSADELDEAVNIDAIDAASSQENNDIDLDLVDNEADVPVTDGLQTIDAAQRLQSIAQKELVNDGVGVRAPNQQGMPPQANVGYVAAPMPGAVSAINAGAMIAGALVASPMRMLMSAAHALTQSRQLQRQELINSGASLQMLTGYNIMGMGKGVDKLREARDAMLKDAGIASVLDGISQAAEHSNEDMQSIIREMGVGGKYQKLGDQWESAIKKNRLFEEFENLGASLTRRMWRDQPKLGNTNMELLSDYQKSIQESIDITSGIPSRRGRDGKMQENLHQQFSAFGNIIRQVIEKIREVIFGRSSGANSPTPS